MSATVEQVQKAARGHARRLSSCWKWFVVGTLVAIWVYVEVGIAGLWALAALSTVFPVVNSLYLLNLVSDIGVGISSLTLRSANLLSPADMSQQCAQCNYHFFLDWFGSFMEFFWAALLTLVVDTRWQPNRSPLRFVIVGITVLVLIWESLMHFALMPSLLCTEHGQGKELSLWRALWKRFNVLYFHYFRNRKAPLLSRSSPTMKPTESMNSATIAAAHRIVFPARSMDPTRLYRTQPELEKVVVYRVVIHGLLFAGFLTQLGLALAAPTIVHAVRAVEHLTSPAGIVQSHLEQGHVQL